MATLRKSALILSSEAKGLDALDGARKNAEDAGKVLRGMHILPECWFGGRISLKHFMEKIEEFFGIESEVHILWGIFHGKKGCWVLYNNELVRFFFILQKWYFARQKGTAHHLLIVSDACESGQMVSEAAELKLEDVSVQASCHPSFTSLDTEEETFSALLVWRLERLHEFPFDTDRALDMKTNLERSILNCHQPCFYSAVAADDLGWSFIDVHSRFSEDPFDGSEGATLSGSVSVRDEGSRLPMPVAPVTQRDEADERDRLATRVAFLAERANRLPVQRDPGERKLGMFLAAFYSVVTCINDTKSIGSQNPHRPVSPVIAAGDSLRIRVHPGYSIIRRSRLRALRRSQAKTSLH